MKRHTKKGEWVLDAFIGCGTTLIESQRLGRNGIGVEFQKDVAGKARKLISYEPNEYGVVNLWKSRCCRQCKETDERGTFVDINHFSQGGPNWDPKISSDNDCG